METQFTVTKFDKDYYRNRYITSMNHLTHKTAIIVDLEEQIITLKERLTLTEKSQLDNTGNNNNA